MARIGKADVHGALMRAAQHIQDAGGKDGIVSRADIKSKLAELDGTERNLVDIFFRFIDHRDAAPGARITKKDIDKAVAYAKEKMVDKYDVNNNGLSASEISQMSTTAQLAVQLSKELRMAASMAKEMGAPESTAQIAQQPDLIVARYGIMPPAPFDPPPIVARYGIVPPAPFEPPPIVMRYGIMPPEPIEPPPVVARYGIMPPDGGDSNLPPVFVPLYGIMPTIIDG